MLISDENPSDMKGSVKFFGAKGDGVTDDTDAIEAACAAKSGLLYFPQGTYVISRTVLIDMAKTGRIRLSGAGATIRHTGPGPALHLIGHHRTSANPELLDAKSYSMGVMPLVEGIAIEGAHSEADGLRLDATFKATLSAIVVRDCRHGIHIVGNNRNVLINGVHVYNNREVGIYLDNVNLHQINISASHISYNGGGGIKVEEGNIRNIQINGNDIEYNYDNGGSDVWFIAGKIGIREGAITGNTIQAISRPGGVNVRIEGFRPDSPLKAGLLSMTGNHISSQNINVQITDSRGIVIGNNTMTRGAERNIRVVRSSQININHNILDANPDYGEKIVGGIHIEDSSSCIVQGVVVSGCHGGSAGRGGTIEVVRSKGVSITDCTLTDSYHRDVWLEDVHESRVSGAIVRHTEKTRTAESIVECGKSDHNMIIGNIMPKAKGGALRQSGEHTVAVNNMETST